MNTFSYLPLLLLPLPLSLSPVHLILLLSLTYLLNRPCIYCSLLLIILFASSCYWSDRCLIDNDCASVTAWFVPRIYTTINGGNLWTKGNDSTNTTSFVQEIIKGTASGAVQALKDSAIDVVVDTRRNTTFALCNATSFSPEVGVGAQWLRQLLGKSEWTLPCLGFKVVL
jgi:phosphoribosyl-AMP cyclohydrolase